MHSFSATMSSFASSVAAAGGAGGRGGGAASDSVVVKYARACNVDPMHLTILLSGDLQLPTDAESALLLKLIVMVFISATFLGSNLRRLHSYARGTLPFCIICLHLAGWKVRRFRFH